MPRRCQATAPGSEACDQMNSASPERFRVVTENEFFEGACLAWSGMPARAPHESRWTRRVAGAALLAGAVSAVGGAVAVSMSPPARHSRGRDAARAAAQSRQPMSPVVARSLLASVEVRARTLRAARRELGRAGSGGRPEGRRTGFVSPRRREVQVARRTALPSTGGVQRAVSARNIARPALAATSGATQSHTRQPEFGFER